MLDSRKEDMITYYMKGENISSIAKKLNVSRQTIYDWLDLEEVKAELDRRRQEIVRQGNEIIVKDLNDYITKIKELAKQTEDKRTSFSANVYLVERVMGKVSNKADLGEEDNENNNINAVNIQDEIAKYKAMKQAK